MTMVDGQRRAMQRWRRPVLVVLVLLVVGGVVAGFLGPWSGVFVQLSLPRQHGDLHVVTYRRAGPLPEVGEGIGFALPQATAHGWYMAAVGHFLPAGVAVPGAVLSGELRGPVGTPLPVYVLSRNESEPRVEVLLTTTRVNAWLLDAAKRDGSPWVARIDAGSRIDDSAEAPPAGWDLRLRLTLSGLAARRDGQPGLVRLEDFAALIDLRWLPGTVDTRIAARVTLQRLRLRDQHSELAGEVPSVVLAVIAGLINAGLRDHPPVLPFVVPSNARLALEVIPPLRIADPAF